MKQELVAALVQTVKTLFDMEIDIELTRPDEQFGDYAANVALQLAAKVHKNPREVAEAIAASLREHYPELFLEITIAGPGFLNIKLTDTELLKALDTAIEQQFIGQIVLAEYSDPNPFKPLHAGHLYTTLVGDAIARLLRAGGAQVTRINYGGDVGLHVGKAMWAIVRELGGEHPARLDDIPVENRAAWLGERYVQGNSAYEDDESARAEIIAANKRVYKIHAQNDHQSSFAEMYWTCRDWSYDYLGRLYTELQVTPFDRVIPESEIVPLGLQTVQEQLSKGVYQESDGAVVFKGEPYGLHTRVFINSQGLPTYEAKDVGLIMTKWQDYHFDRSIVITANEQAQYMEVMLKSVEQFEPEIAAHSEHLTHGVVKLTGGVKMSSRKGNTVGAIDIIDAASAANKLATGQDNQTTVLGAIKYAFLKQRIGADIIYDPDESVSLQGNSGPYLQYAHARARSILRKAGVSAAGDIADLTPDERSLVRKLGEFSEVVARASSELMPHHICTYLYELAQIFNRFYEHNRVVGDARQVTRLALVSQYASVLKQGLDLLGIDAPEQM